MDSNPRFHKLIQHLRVYTPHNDDDDKQSGDVTSSTHKFMPKRAAVLICLFEGELGELRVILTKRSATLSTHSGEVSLPGGKVEEGDADERETALREAHEEIGLNPSLVTVVAVLEPFMSKHILRVVPVVGIITNIKAFTPIANKAEVETVFDAPLEMFLKDENRRSEERERAGNRFLIHYFDYEAQNNKKFLIWGFTARLLIHAASIVYRRPPSFTEGKPKFRIPNSATASSSAI